MSIWGKIVGGAAGLAVGGPLGALLGVAAGHVYDRFKSATSPIEQDGDLDDTRRMAFTVAVITLGAKMAKADGQVTREEVDAFKRIFKIPPQEMSTVGKIFDAAKQDATGFEPYARQVADIFANSPAVLEELLAGLFEIAKSDGVIHELELDYLRKVATIFGLEASRFEQFRNIHMPEDQADPYQILGVSPGDDDATIKAAWRKLTREHHPDQLVAQGMPEEFVTVATEKMASINAAYDKIQQMRT